MLLLIPRVWWRVLDVVKRSSGSRTNLGYTDVAMRTRELSNTQIIHSDDLRVLCTIPLSVINKRGSVLDVLHCINFSWWSIRRRFVFVWNNKTFWIIRFRLLVILLVLFHSVVLLTCHPTQCWLQLRSWRVTGPSNDSKGCWAVSFG